MRKTRIAVARVVCCLLVATPAVLAGQDERVAVQPPQKPDRTTHYTMTQDTTIDISMPNAPAPGPMQMTMKMSSNYTQVNGHPDEKGGFEARITIDGATFEATMNGMPAPIPNPMDGLAGGTATAVYDAGGKLVEIKGLPESKALEGFMRRLLGSASMRDASLAVGETTTLPLDIALPLPTGGATGGGGMQGQLTVKLLAIEREGADRIARFSTALASTIGVPPMEMTMNGTGAMLVNADRGFVKANDMQMTLDGTIQAPGGAGEIKMHGTINVSVNGKE